MVAVGCVLAMFIASLLPWFTATIDPRFAPMPDRTIIGWESTAVVLGLVLPLAMCFFVSVCTILRDFGAGRAKSLARRCAGLCCWLSGLALAIFIIPLFTGKDSKLEAIGPRADGGGYDIHRGAGLYLAAAAAGVLVIATLVRWLTDRAEPAEDARITI